MKQQRHENTHDNSLKNVDFIIIGQGLCGTFLSYFLLEAGQKILVIDDNQPSSASKVASGVINPVTGRRMVRTWRIEELLPFALRTYKQFGNELGADLVKQCDLLDFHPSLQMKEAFEKRLAEETTYLHKLSGDEWKQYFTYYYDAGIVSPCLLVDINALLTKWREQLQLKNSLLIEHFNVNDCTVNSNEVVYKNVTARKIIFCDGVTGIDNPFFKNLPYAPNKGEAIIARIPGLPQDHIYKQGLSIVPWKEGLFWIGSSYEWNFSDAHPTATFKQKVTQQLTYWLKIPN